MLITIPVTATQFNKSWATEGLANCLAETGSWDNPCLVRVLRSYWVPETTEVIDPLTTPDLRRHQSICQTI